MGEISIGFKFCTLQLSSNESPSRSKGCRPNLPPAAPEVKDRGPRRQVFVAAVEGWRSPHALPGALPRVPHISSAAADEMWDSPILLATLSWLQKSSERIERRLPGAKPLRRILLQADPLLLPTSSSKPRASARMPNSKISSKGRRDEAIPSASSGNSAAGSACHIAAISSSLIS